MEIQENSLPVFYISRILGLAPYVFRQNGRNRVDEIRRLPWLCVYSICFLLTAVSLTFRFIFIDSYDKLPIRMRTPTQKFVTVFDVCVVVGACVCGALTGLIGKRLIQRINANLRKADDELALFNDPVNHKKRGIWLLFIVFSLMTCMIALDIISKLKSAKKYKTKQEQLGKLAKNLPNERIHIENYLSFYLLYYILMALHTQFAQAALGIYRRYNRLNCYIKNIFSLKKILESASKTKATKVDVQNATDTAVRETNNENHLPGSNPIQKPTGRITTVSRANLDENHATPAFSTGKYSASTNVIAYGKFPTVTTPTRTITTTLTRASFVLDRLSYTHAILGETVTLVSRVYGLTLLVMLASCLLHLVATSYFLFLELLNDPDFFVATLQLLWCCFHISRLLLLVEPCHMATAEARKTIIIVCEVLRNCKDMSVEPILQRFWRQLIADKTYYFTASGMCTVERQILTSISGAIATYLVILIQFQKADGD
ncbi:gustatory receptor for sugar taste 43a-like [Contarinia nasturtii]|uniref:gustatory receptor for sugar taste 43a-like n=1 Tax=Contarinia nasturtii TaxID=265458 RepID=UPI0012D3E74F|nr:gustatory receptor for sugar taste 43a-like [Contarinia nasturtii]